MNAGKEIRIGLLWHSAGAGNLGVGALTVGNMAIARAAAAACGLVPRFKILQVTPDTPAYISEPDVETFDITGRSMASPGGYWKALEGLDCILDIGAGDSFADIYGLKRFAYLWATKELAYLRGTPVILSPQTIGPFTRQPYRALAGHAMARAVSVVARDPISFEAIHRLSPRARALQSVDVAFRLPYRREPRVDSGITEVGVNVSGLLMNSGYGADNAFGLQVDYADLMRRLIAALIVRPLTRVHLVCHVNSDRMPADDDRRVADQIAREFPAVVRAPDFHSPSDAKTYIAGMDFFVGGRMHACIAAFSAGVPVVPISYSRKFAGLFQGVLKYPYEVPVAGLSTEAALAYILERLEDRAPMQAAIAEGLKAVDAALGVYDTELRRLFMAVTSRR